MVSRSGTPAAYNIAYPQVIHLVTKIRLCWTDLCAGEVMVLGKSRRIPIQRQLAITRYTIRQMGKIKKSWFLWQILLLEIGWVHSVCTKRGSEIDYLLF